MFSPRVQPREQSSTRTTREKGAFARCLNHFTFLPFFEKATRGKREELWWILFIKQESLEGLT